MSPLLFTIKVNSLPFCLYYSLFLFSVPVFLLSILLCDLFCSALLTPLSSIYYYYYYLERERERKALLSLSAGLFLFLSLLLSFSSSLFSISSAFSHFSSLSSISSLSLTHLPSPLSALLSLTPLLSPLLAQSLLALFFEQAREVKRKKYMNRQ